MGVHTFPKRISIKVNAIERTEFELTHHDPATQLFKNYPM